MTDTAGRTKPAIPAMGWARVALRVLGIVIWLIFCLLRYQAYRPFTEHNPTPRIFFAGICRILDIRLAIHGEKAGKGAFLLANHVSWMDIAALCAATGTAFVAHDGLAANPLLHWFCRLNDTVFIARHDRRSVAAQVEQVREAIRDTGALTIFPEGGTSDGLDIAHFKSSLLSALTPVPAGISVQPVWLDYGLRGNEVAWVDEESGVDNFLKIAGRSRPIDLALHFLPILDGEELTNRKTIASAARDAIARQRRETGAETF